jgi:hypothetical protein
MAARLPKKRGQKQGQLLDEKNVRSTQIERYEYTATAEITLCSKE